MDKNTPKTGDTALRFEYIRKSGPLGASLAAQARALWETIREIVAWIAARFDHPGDIFILLFATLLGLGARAFFLSQPMRLDESYTFLYYLSQGRDPFYYNIPNNHVLHTLLVWLSVAMGGMGPVAIRFPAFLAGVLSIPAMFLVCKAFDKNAGALAAIGMALFPYLILYSSTARGYSLLVLLTLLLILVGKYFLEKGSLAVCILISLVSALGLLTMPTMTFVLAGFYPWLTLSLLLNGQNVRAVFRDFLFPCGILTALLTVLFYTPTVIASNGAQAIFSNQFVDPRSWDDFLKHLYPHYRQTLSDFSRDIPGLLEYGGLLLVGVGLFSALRKRDWALSLLLPSIVIGGLVLFFARHAIPFARTWIYLIPFALLFADLGYSYLAQKLQPKIRLGLTALIVTAGLFFAGFLISTNAIGRYTDTGAFPEAAAVAQYLKPLMTGDEFIVVSDTANYPTFYYLCYAGAPPQNTEIDPATAKRYFVTQKGWHTLGDLTDEPAVKIFEFGDAAIYTSTSGKRPLYPAFVFDCRETRK